MNWKCSVISGTLLACIEVPVILKNLNQKPNYSAIYFMNDNKAYFEMTLLLMIYSTLMNIFDLFSLD